LPERHGEETLRWGNCESVKSGIAHSTRADRNDAKRKRVLLPRLAILHEARK
jgi:hypothetical protein